MKRHMTASVVALAGMLTLAGCSAAAPPEADPFDVAWEACVASNEKLWPDGLTDARTGKTYDAEAICHRTIAEQGEAKFIELYTDPEWIEMYENAERH